MSLKVIHAVQVSRIEPRVRHLASTLAYHAHNDGTHVYPGIDLLAQKLGRTKSTVWRQLQALLETGVLVRDGYYAGHTRQYRFDLEALGRYVPARDSRASRREAMRRLNARRRLARPSSDSQVAATGQGDANGKLATSATLNPTTSATLPHDQCDFDRPSVPVTRTTSASQSDDQCDSNSRPVRVQEEESTEEVQIQRTAATPPRAWKAEKAWADEKAREPNGDNQKVLKKLAYLELKSSLEQGEDLSDSDLRERIKCAAARHRIDYGRHPDVSVQVVREACEWARFWEASARAVGQLPRAAPSPPTPDLARAVS